MHHPALQMLLVLAAVVVLVAALNIDPQDINVFVSGKGEDPDDWLKFWGNKVLLNGPPDACVVNHDMSACAWWRNNVVANKLEDNITALWAASPPTWLPKGDPLADDDDDNNNNDGAELQARETGTVQERVLCPNCNEKKWKTMCGRSFAPYFIPSCAQALNHCGRPILGTKYQCICKGKIDCAKAGWDGKNPS